MNITITGDCPSKKNNKQIFKSRGTGRLIVIPGKVHQEWYPQALRQLHGVPSVSEVAKVTLTFYPKTKRKSDLTNKAESIMDLLVDAKIIEDDNWFIIPSLELKFGEVDPQNPRVEIELI